MKETKPSKKNAKSDILDAAEKLFSEHGFDGVSIRDITKEADVRLASVNYYFGSKIGLMNEVILRRSKVISQERKELLENINFDKLDIHKSLEALAFAFIKPLLVHSTKGDPGWKNYCKLIAQIAIIGVVGPHEALSKFNNSALGFVEAIKQIMPKISDRNAHYAFQFLLGSTLYVFTENKRIDILSDGKYKSTDLNEICEELVHYISAGLYALSEH